MKYFLKQTIYLLPILLMGVSFLSSIIPLLGYNFDYVLWGNIGGFSLITDVLFFYVFYYGKYCIFTRIFPISLFVVNLVNIWGLCNEKLYYAWYELVIFVLTLVPLLIYELNRRIFR
jgi:hypothetical protein